MDFYLFLFFLLQIPVFVATNAAGDGPTPCQRYLLFVATNMAENCLLENIQYVSQFHMPVTPPPSP